MGEQTILEIGTITLDWSAWVPWTDVSADNRGGAGVSIPNKVAGVYEVRSADNDGDERTYIGKAGDLRLRVRQGLVKGKLPHSGGKRIRAQEDLSRLAIRWAVTDRPAAAEEELHRAYRARFGRLPLYTFNS
ncbi:MAG: hypothetical protein ACLPKI_31735 [Streptosporangiaceae bacterium]